MQKSTRSSSAWLGGGRREASQRGPRRGAVVGGARQAVAERAAALEQLDRMAEVAVALLDLLERAAPEVALLRAAARVGEHDRQRDLAVAEVVAQALAEHHLARAVVEHVVGQLEGDAEVQAVVAQRRGLGRRPLGDQRADLGRGGEQRRGLAPTTSR